MRLTVASHEAVKYACMKFHYAKAVPVHTLGYNVYNNKNEWCGVVVFGSGATQHIGDEYGLPQGEVLELTRVALNGKQKDGGCTSQCVSMALKRLKKDCPCCRLVVSYADCDQSHLGTIYQATNWIYVGTRMENQKDSSWIINGKKVHGRSVSRIVKMHGGLNGMTREEFLRKYIDPNAYEHTTKGKRKYLMPLDKEMRKKLIPLSKSYPKESAWVKIDRSIFKKKEEQNG